MQIAGSGSQIQAQIITDLQLSCLMFELCIFKNPQIIGHWNPEFISPNASKAPSASLLSSFGLLPWSRCFIPSSFSAFQPFMMQPFQEQRCNQLHPKERSPTIPSMQGHSFGQPCGHSRSMASCFLTNQLFR